MKTRQKIRRGLILFSFFLFPALFFYQSPIIILDASHKGIINGSFIIFLLLFFSSLFLGRSFCGWLCPAAGCQESIFPIVNKKISGGDFIKWIIWIPWISTIVILAVMAGGYRKIDFFFQTTHGVSITSIESFIAYYIVLLILIVLPACIIGKRSFCHHLCLMAPFMIIGRNINNRFHWSSLRLTPNQKLCDNCQACSRNCPMSLPVEQMVQQYSMENTECILCGNCVDICKKQAITFCWK